MAEEVKSKRSVSDIIIDRFLKDVDEKGEMPWQRPYERFNAFNYFTKKPYRGINRLLLPFGEYMTRKQINDYNAENNEDFRFQKGIVWYPVVYFTVQEKEISKEELLNCFPEADLSEDGYKGHDRIWTYYVVKGVPVKRRNVLKYFDVADRKHFKNSKGEMLPSRIDTGEVTITYEDPKRVIDNYVARENLKVQWDSADTPCYIPLLDKVELNPYHKNQESWYSTAFHEFAHSTGHRSRLNRQGIHYPKGSSDAEKKNLYAVEECIAEITASLLCGECNVYDYETTGTSEYDNNIAYVQAWKKRIKDWGSEFIYIVSQADKAFMCIVGEDENKER